MFQRLSNIYYLGLKELMSIWQDKIMIFMLIYGFTLAIYLGGSMTSMEIHNAPIAFVDEDRSALSSRLIDAFYEPRFLKPDVIPLDAVDPGLDSGSYTFVVILPFHMEKDLLSGKTPSIQVNIDATRMSQAGIGAGYINQIVNKEVASFLSGTAGSGALPVDLAVRMKFNPNLTSSWFGAVMEIISMVSILSIMLTGAALVREREHGTLEHLLVMPLSAGEIMLGKIWPSMAVILIGATLSLKFVVEGILSVPVAGSEGLFLTGAFLVLFASTSLGVFIGTVARSMPQMGLITMMTIMVMMILGGSFTPYDSMPEPLQKFMLISPMTHFVSMAQAILYRGAGLETVWPNMVWIVGVGLVYFLLALAFFRRSLQAESR